MPGGGRLLPGCRASGVGRSPLPDRLSLGRAAGARYPLAVAAGVVGVGTRHLSHSARRCGFYGFCSGFLKRKETASTDSTAKRQRSMKRFLVCSHLCLFLVFLLESPY